MPPACATYYFAKLKRAQAGGITLPFAEIEFILRFAFVLKLVRHFQNV